ncbi:MAG: GldG family protein [Chloroflexi bacterium]|nr:GldG family protein [Chloroflexota bacterium]
MQNNRQDSNFTGIIAVLGLVSLFIGLVLTVLVPDFKLAAWGLLGLGVILLAGAFVLDFKRVKGAVTGRRGRMGAGATVMASILVGIVILANAISIGNYKRFDATALAQFTLTNQTKDVLGKLEMPVKAIGFFTPGDPVGDFTRDLLTEYSNNTDKLTLEFIDPDEKPDQARKYGVTQYETVVFESENRFRLVQEIDENKFTSAILEVTGTAQKKVYFLTGHDEADINSFASNGYAAARKGLLDDLYLVDTLNLITNPAIPQDAAVLIIAAPQKPLSSSEAELILRYLISGGQVLILVNPDSPQETNQIISLWGISFESGTIIDPDSYVTPQKDIPSVTAERTVFGLPVAYFPGATAITIQKELPQSIQAQPLIITTKDAWLEKEFASETEPTFNDKADVIGPLNMGVLIAAVPLVDPTKTEGVKLTRLAVIGDSDFASNQHFNNVNNSDLFLNTVNWLSEETSLIAIRRKVLPFRRMVVSPEMTKFINYSSIGLLPVVVLIIGMVVWWRRR